MNEGYSLSVSCTSNAALVGSDLRRAVHRSTKYERSRPINLQPIPPPNLFYARPHPHIDNKYHHLYLGSQSHRTTKVILIG